MNNTNFDVPIGIIFFNRPWTLYKVFESIKLIKPSILYLYQDGPRNNRPDDIENIEKCRAIFKDIDWDCKIHTYYQKENVGVDPSEYIAIKWVFSNEEKAIFLEDDDVPSLSFYKYCSDLLERYKNDERINIICGLNQIGKFNTENDYVFTSSGSITGWASWKRVIDTWDENYSFLDNHVDLYNIKKILGKKIFREFHKTCLKHKKTNKPHYESIMKASCLLNSRINIAPRINLISNIGIGENASHGTNNIKTLPKKIRRIFFQHPQDFEFPLIHPNNVIEDFKYTETINKVMTVGHPFLRKLRLLESIYLRIIHGDINGLFKSLLRKFYR